MKRKNILLAVAGLISALNLFSQSPIKSFTEDPVKFPEELEKHFESSEKKDGREYIEKFVEITWNNPKLTDEHKRVIYRTANQMLKKRLKTTPEYHDYLDAVSNFIASGQPDKNYFGWHECIDKLSQQRSSKYFVEFIELGVHLFKTNSFYKSTTAEWTSDNPNYTFNCDSTIPKITFPQMTLRCFSKGDSSVIFNTRGVYFPTLGKFFGYGGKVNWARVGIDENTVYAELKKYEVILKTGGYHADSAVLYQNVYFKGKPMLGVLTEKIIADATEKNASYPRFVSYSQRYQIKNLFENVDYDGGFTQMGGRFIGSGTKDQPANVIFKRMNKPFLVISSKGFTITNEKITANNAGVKFNIESDSIVHPAIDFKYIIADKAVTLYRSEDGASKTPYYDSWHEIDMFVEEIYWKIDDPLIDLRTIKGSTLGEADFQSSNFYRQIIYDKLQGLDFTNPLITIRDFVEKSNANNRDFFVEELARYMRFDPVSIRPLMLKLSYMGFLIYNLEDDKIVVKDKLFNYIAARVGRLDYDVLDFFSTVHPGTSNASLNLLNYDLTIKGVNNIVLSDSQNVVIIPKNREIVLKKNRDFSFAGHVKAGRFDYYGKEFSFDYDKFRINLKNVDSLTLKVQSFQATESGYRPLVRVKTVIQNINGDLEIDHPRNKSGVRPYSKYPVFYSRKESFVYYNKKSIQDGVYNRDKFYFKLDTFTIDSLDNFRPDALRLTGTFASSGIFPEFRDALSLQPDYSLGLVRSTPPGGFALYGGKAKYTNEIRLTHEGLRGDGTIDFVTSTTTSKDFIFFPDSMNTHAQSFVVKEQKKKPEFPQVQGDDVYVHWMPKKDVMQVTKKEKPIVMLNGQAEFNGRLELTPELLAGNGKVNFSHADLSGKNIRFAQNKFMADTSDFNLNSQELAALAFSTNNVKSNVNFDTRVAEFKSNGAGSIVKFPVNQYICYMDNFKWFMDQNAIELSAANKTGKPVESQDSLALEGPEFISVHPQQDSLRFNSPAAKYDLKNHIISAKEVKYINVADAEIYPDKGDVVIERGAKMQTLNNSRIVANKITRHHQVLNATVNIFSKKNYVGSGYYDYVDELKSKQTIYFASITVDTSLQTFAEAVIPDSVKFSLSPNFGFRGKTKLLASNEFLFFEGATQIQHGCEQVKKTWFRFESQIDPNKIYIPITKDPVDEKGNPIAAGIMSTTDSTHVYSAFVSPRRNKNDVEVLTSDGFLHFDKQSREYRISNKEKLVERSLPGNYISLAANNCVMYGEGKMNLGADLGQVMFQPVGNAHHYLIPDSTAFEMIVAMNFFFDDNALDKMAEAVIAKSELPSTDFTRPVFEKGLRELIGKDKADKLISQLNLYGSFRKFPDELKYTMLLTDVKMQWNKAAKSYMSTGKIGIGNINKNQVNKYVDGKIQLERKRTGDVLHIYLEIENGKWYYFNYSRGLMQAISSDDNFNTIIKELKPEKRESKAEKGQQSYKFILGQGSTKTMFLKKFERSQRSESEE